jgi:tetratricopeptide (TPR) repeat protein
MLPRACLLPLALALLLSAPGAQAQTEQDRAAARDLAQQADARSAAGNLDEAIDLFQKADALVPAPSLKLAVARLFVRKGKLVEAQILMQDIARSAPVALEPAPWARARAEAREEAEALVPRLCTLEISLRGPAGGAPVQVSLDDEPLAPASIGVPRVLNPGPHTTTALLARQHSDKIKAQCPDLRCPPSLESDIEARRTLSSASTTSFLFAGLGLGAMVLGLVLREEAPVQVQVGPAWLSVARTF